MIFGGFCSPEVDSLMSDLTIFGLKYVGQHPSIPGGQIKILALFS